MANAFGLQVFRTITFKFKWLARRALLKKDVATDGIAAALKKDGVVVVNDFLEPDIYQRLREYYHDAITDQLRPTAVGPKVIAPTVCSPRANIEVPQEIRQAFVENTTLNDAIEINAAHRQNIRPLIRLHHYFALPEEIGTREAARTDELHYDVPIDNMHAFFYMEPCDRNNAAFEYAAGTHRFGLRRLIVEYFDSLVQSKARQGKPEAKVQPLKDWMTKLLETNPTPLEAPGNTLIIFNTMGLHRRGRFSAAGTREAILLDYRYLDAGANAQGYGPVLRLLSN